MDRLEDGAEGSGRLSEQRLPDESRPCVAIVDDNPADRELVLRALRTELPHVSAIEVAGPVGLAAAIANRDVDLVITDYELRWTNGIVVLQLFRTHNPTTPVVMFTGSGNEEIAVKAMKLGLADYVIKRPDQYRRVAAIVATTLARDRAERERADVEFRLRDTLDSLNVGAFRCRVDGSLLEVNRAFRELVGEVDPGETSLLSLVDPDQRTRVARALKEFPDQTTQRVNLLSGRDARVPAELRLIHRVDADSQVVVDGLVEDHSEREQRKVLERRLAHSAHLASLGRLAAGIAHEVNNPSTFVLLNLQLIQRMLAAMERSDTATDERTQTFGKVGSLLSECVHGIERIASIVRDLRMFSRPPSDAMTLIDINATLQWSCRMVAHDVEYRATMSANYGELPPVRGDCGRLSQIFVNLLMNAGQAIPEGDPSQYRVSIETRREDDQVVVTIADTGAGIAPEDLAHMFEPFYTTKGPNHGTGLGLAISAEILAEHGGGIQVQSELGVGTTFEVRLPAAGAVHDVSSEVSSEVSSQVSSEASPPGRPRVLIVDDEPALARACAAAIDDSCDVEIAAEGRSALTVLENDSGFDAIVCDVMMHGMDGPTLYETAVRAHPELADRFIFMSGGVFTPRARDFVEHSTAPYLAKPLDLPELLRAIRRRLAERTLKDRS